MKSETWLQGFIFFCVFLLPGNLQSQTLNKLIEGAKNERTVKVGVTLRWEVGGKPVAKKIVEVFQSRYPFLKVDFERIGGSAERERLLNELAGGKVSYDVAVLAEDQVPPALKANLIELVDWESLGVHPEVTYRGKTGVEHQTRLYGIVYNRKLISDEVGQRLTWEDCVDAKWKGKIASDTRPRHLEILWQPDGWGREKTLAHAKKLGENGTIFERSRTGTMTKLAVGEYPIVCGAYYDTYTDHFRYMGGRHLGFTPGKPVLVGSPDVVFVPRGARHPNAAKLWTVWSVSEEGQVLLDDLATTGHPIFQGTEAAKMIKEKKSTLRLEEQWIGKSGEILKEIIEAIGLPVVLKP
jgi:iron(III) transport system substrate-binding protein